MAEESRCVLVPQMSLPFCCNLHVDIPNGKEGRMLFREEWFGLGSCISACIR